VLLSHNATIGRVAIVPQFDGRMLVGTSLTYFRLNPQNLLPRYFAAYLAGADFQNQLAAVMSHSTRNQVPITAQRDLSVVVPPLDVQQKIADTLGSLDDKIEQNRRAGRALDGLARATCKAWFVDFEPVKDKAAGQTSFPGMPPTAFAALPDRLTDSPLGPVPQGWAVGKMGDVGEQRREQVAPSEVHGETPYIGLEHMPRRDITLSAWGRAESVTSSKFRFRRGDILFGKLRPYFHKVGPAPLDGVCSTDIVPAS
jgi:type I restriction enzyme S subunit